MNPENEIFETCDSNQTEIEQHTKTFERCNSNQIKTGRGGARKNSGKKSSGIETVTVRIDKRLLNAVTEIKGKFKTTESLDDIVTKNNDAELKRQNVALNNVNKHLCKELEKAKTTITRNAETYSLQISFLKADHNYEIEKLQEQLFLAQRGKGAITGNGIDEKLRKRLIQFCHPDKNHDREELANELMQALNGLKK